MNVNPGGVLPKMRDTYWGDRLQKMVYPDGTPKWMKAVLQETGVNITKMKSDEMRDILQNIGNLKYERTKVEHVLLFHTKVPLWIEPHREGMRAGQEVY